MLWTLSTVLMTAGTTEHEVIQLWWGSWFAFVALVPSFALVVRYYEGRNREACTDVVALMAAARESNVRHVQR